MDRSDLWSYCSRWFQSIEKLVLLPFFIKFGDNYHIRESEVTKIVSRSSKKALSCPLFPWRFYVRGQWGEPSDSTTSSSLNRRRRRSGRPIPFLLCDFFLSKSPSFCQFSTTYSLLFRFPFSSPLAPIMFLIVSWTQLANVLTRPPLSLLVNAMFVNCSLVNRSSV